MLGLGRRAFPLRRWIEERCCGFPGPPEHASARASSGLVASRAGGQQGLGEEAEGPWGTFTAAGEAVVFSGEDSPKSPHLAFKLDVPETDQRMQREIPCYQPQGGWGESRSWRSEQRGCWVGAQTRRWVRSCQCQV